MDGTGAIERAGEETGKTRSLNFLRSQISDVIGSRPRPSAPLAGVHDFELELDGHLVEFLDQQGLILLKTVVQVVSQPQVHAGFPIVHGLGFYDTQREGFDVDPEIADQVGDERETEHIPDPLPIVAAHEIPAKRRCRLM